MNAEVRAKVEEYCKARGVCLSCLPLFLEVFDEGVNAMQRGDCSDLLRWCGVKPTFKVEAKA